MFKIDENLIIHITRGDAGSINVTAEDENGNDYTFKIDDIVRLKITEKKNTSNIVLEKSVTVLEETQNVLIQITDQDSKIGDLINKPVDYWYEIELNPDNNGQTIIGYDENGPKIFRLYPEGGDQ